MRSRGVAKPSVPGLAVAMAAAMAAATTTSASWRPAASARGAAFAGDVDAPLGPLLAAVTNRSDPERAEAAAAALVLRGEPARAAVAALVGGAEHPPAELTSVLASLDSVALLRAEAADGGLPFWEAYDEARARIPRFDVVLRAAIPDDAARKQVEEADAAAAQTVGDVLDRLRGGGAPDDATRERLAAAGPAALMRLLDALVGPDPAVAAAAVAATASLGAAESLPHFVWLAADLDASRSAVTVAAGAAVTKLGGWTPPDDAAQASAARDLWWRERRAVDRGGFRHLVHRALLGLEAAGVSAGVAEDRLARLRVVGLPVRWSVWVGVEDTPRGSARLTPATVQRLRRVWRENAPPPATWRGALSVLGGATRYDGAAVGEGGERSGLRSSYEVAAEEAPADALAAASAATVPSVIARIYALRALVAREGLAPRAAEATAKLACAPERVPCLFGCTSSRERVFDLLCADVADSCGDASRRQLLEFLLDRDLRPSSLEELLRTVPLDASRRPQLRKLADAGFAPALFGIALLHDPADAPFFAARAEAAGASLLDREELLEALATHGAAGSVRALVKAVPAARARCAAGREWDPMPFLRALAAPGDAAAEKAVGEFLGGDVAKAPEEVLLPVESVLATAPADAFQPLRWNVWEVVRWTPAATVDTFVRSDATRALVLVRRDLAAPFPSIARDTALRRRGVRAERGGTAALLRPRLAALRAADAPAAARWAANCLAGSGWKWFEPLCEEAAAWHDAALVEPLLSSLAATPNPPAVVAITRALLCYGKPEIDARVKRTVDATKDLREGWSGKEIARLLAKLPRSWEAGARE